MNIDLIRANAHPVENGDLDAFIERWGFPIYVEIKMDGERAWIWKHDNEIIAFNKHKSVYTEETHEDLLSSWKSITTASSFLIEGELCSRNGGIYSYLSS